MDARHHAGDQLKAHEDVVLTAYRCPAGKWTIGAGLTAASGGVTLRPGMTISRVEASRLLKLALAGIYEPAVRNAMGAVPQHAFDGAVSFHFNTGAIGRTSWVGANKARNWPQVRSKLALWNRGGGRALPGLERRRREETDVILLDKWPSDLRVASDPVSDDPQFASFVISVSADRSPRSATIGSTKLRLPNLPHQFRSLQAVQCSQS